MPVKTLTAGGGWSWNSGLSVIASLGVDRKFGRSHTLGFFFNYNSQQDLGRLDPSLYQVRGQITYSVSFQPAAKDKVDNTRKP